MYQTIVMTCGVSLVYSGGNLFAKKIEELLPAINIRKQDFLKLLNTNETSKEIEDLLFQWIEQSHMYFQEAKQYPNRVSAEYSMMYELKKRGKLAQYPRVVLILTNTVGGKLVKPLLKNLFEEHFSAVVDALYVNIDVKETKRMSETLGDYMRNVGDALSEGEPSSTCFAPIGGYKVMTSLGYIVGSFLGYPTAYLHEEHQILHEIPPIPVHVDEEFVHQHAEFLRRCQREPVPFESLPYREKQIVLSYTSIFKQEEGYVYLTPFGEFLFEHEKYKHLFDTKYMASKQVVEMIEKNKVFAIQQMKELVKKIKYAEASIFDLQHEKEFETLNQRDVKFHLYKAPTNGQVFRLAYRYDKQEDVLFANYLWFDHDRYEREAAAGKGLYEQYSEFANITDMVIGRSTMKIHE